jgi:L-ribulose-5-phosphate 3-epimerase
MSRIGIMQGRLSPPTDGKFQSFPKYSWKDEFYRAQEAGLKSIEWIFEADEWEKNPISSANGILEINELIKKTGVIVESVCADYFMDIPYFPLSDKLKSDHKEKLKWLAGQSIRIGARFVDLPFVDASKIESRDQFVQVKEFLEPALNFASKTNLVIALETNLGPEDFLTLLNENPHPMLRANYDTGNSSGIGYNCVEELNAYGNRIATVHIKDRLLNNGTKPLGTGSADFPMFFTQLARLNYKGPVILQVAREGDEVETAIKNRIFVESYLSKYRI